MQIKNQDTKIRLYHGSLDDIDKIDLSKGKSHRDFGPGYYATSQKRHAESIAKKNLRVHENKQRLELRR